jgi:sulfonate transport system permease protein
MASRSPISDDGPSPAEARLMNVKSDAAPRCTLGPESWASPRIAAVTDAALPFMLPLAMLLLWQVTAAFQWLPVQILPPPAMVAATLIDLAKDGEIVANLRISLWRISVGFLCGGAAGLAFGTMLGVSRTLNLYLGPLFKAVAQIPSLGWVPILILIFGLDEIVKILIIAKACFVPLVVATSEGIRAVPQQYMDVAKVLQLGRRSVLLKLLAPAALPTIFSGIRLALSHAWISLITVEMLAATEGIGYMMVWGRTLFQTDIVIAGMVIIGVIGLALDAGLVRIERRLKRWTPAHV